MGLTELHVGSLGGLHYELYYPNTDDLLIECLDVDDPKALLKANALFWAQHLSHGRVLKLAETYARCSSGLSPQIPAYRAITTAPDIFAEQVEEAKLHLCDQGIGMRQFYRYVETLMILCQLYSYLEYRPHMLTLYEGFTTFELSSLAIYNNCLNPSENPYLPFIETYCTPVIQKIKPDIVWLNGRFSISHGAIARLIKSLFPDAHIAVTGHASEYYSFNKITTQLKRNEPLFAMIDSIILDSSDESRKRLCQAIYKGDSLETVPNLMYARRSNHSTAIRQTHFLYHPTPSPLWESAITRPKIQCVEPKLDPSTVVDIKLFPDHACHWNKCTFCGINQKYEGCITEDDEGNWNVDEQLKAMKHLYGEGHTFLWVFDEAIPANTLRALADGMIDNEIKMAWQARARFDTDFLSEDTCDTLARSGLKEIRFGLESACPRILKLMNKFPESVTLGTIRQIIRMFDAHGISVHCPVIIGYPTETADERQITYGFLEDMARQCPRFTFNINIFGLDITSPVFRKWDEHGISTLRYPCPPEHFIGNILEWDCLSQPFNRGALEKERNAFMRRLLYPWIPSTSLTQPHILYRLCETIRNTLTFKSLESERKGGFKSNEIHQIPQHVVVSNPVDFSKPELYQIFNWHTHGMAEVNPLIGSYISNLKAIQTTPESYIDNPHQMILDTADYLRELCLFDTLTLEGEGT